ncbi:RAQPRD family integrative conjugative element protein [Xanthomonas axonopodis]|uniref:integrative conjugative element protein, RAQPRD family n=1 Tax=Xanthomonas axonopodis TaxID=53413 RepID=UPI003557866F
MTSRATASRAAPSRLPPSGVLAAALLWVTASAHAADAALERERLAGAVRLLAQVERVGFMPDTRAEDSADSTSSRYHFDYARLRDDVGRMQAGIAQYLAPGRAQPRDPSSLAGDYTRDPGGPSQMQMQMQMQMQTRERSR